MTNGVVKTRSISSITDYLEVVEAFSDEDEVLFRGQRRNSWTLAPTIGRLQLRSHTNLRETERELIRAFRRESPPYVVRDFRDDWEMLAMAQHHGLATRLLDWTANPLAGLWFAVKEPPQNRERGCVLMFALEAGDHVADRESTSPFAIKKTKFFQPNHLTPRIVAQAGWFSVHSWNGKRELFARLDHITAYRGRIERILIPAKSFSPLRASLDRLGIHHASMFPDLDGLTEHLNWRNSVLSDEVS